ncbi:bifunctional alpha,alpha-trehalose-phosphate synthase (UDP-forming)/trehalose-phosphatase [Nakamurella leprariae]|uniref:Bifunctional alpha,alpha-trehalose-phosphate synthase (UDP-forming)/trehalose-phosphatase n=1 Tax=Nakamurella leprariae TaxID=2803911 RepID=A0A938Y5Q1_9ACTN|nr:bifunctional alpha,alpha-trehalose-phosphate synthase (UDP-forming)/trehalose-phosphatase [Nakamurella leprariae]MBM9466516.1 bifunctional alpha,alpha-trehalose-phosphate synthase (UDP-forming)/trehalose-phosphatase [Nakamurella leprariae]
MSNPSPTPAGSRPDEQDEQRSGGGGSSLVVVANRLPFDLEQLPDGSTRARPAPGGLVTALAPILSRRRGAWIGWPGQPDVELEPTQNDGIDLHPVTLSADEVADYYEGFSNDSLWPLYHDAVAESQFRREWWDAYQKVNRRFAERAAEVAAPGATVWVHDYQLQLVPAMLRAMREDVRIGFFLHIPFPPVELFSRLPWRSQIITGMLGADLVGFHLPGGARNFVRLATRLTGATSSGSVLHHQGRTIKAGAFPISIDSAGQSALAATPEVHEQARQLRSDLGNPDKIILGVDRLDYTKGIDVRLQAFGELLAEGDPSVENAVMVQIATPSRERLESYIRMREDIERRVGAINGDFGRIGFPAVHYMHQSLPREDLAAFYVAADVMTVTPLRDGMNLVAKEYVACRVDGGGVLLLSEFTGAARELRTSLLVNPYDTDGVKEGLRRALSMSNVEARRRMRTMRRQVLTHDVDRWAAAFLSALEGTRDLVAEAAARLPEDVVASLNQVSEVDRLLVATDFDGCLAPIVDDPAAARPLPESMQLLEQLATVPGTEVAVVSGRALDVLRELLVADGAQGATDGDPGAAAGTDTLGHLHLIGSHGAETHGDHGAQRLSEEESRRLTRLRLELQQITAEYPAVRLESKPTGVAVHLRGLDEADTAAVTTAVEENPATWTGVHLLRGKKVLELTVVTTDKGRAVRRLSAAEHITATVYIGDDVTDENAFGVLTAPDLGIKVGPGRTAADVRVADPDRVTDVLRVLAGARERAAGRRSGSETGED